jgi:ferredoxin
MSEEVTPEEFNKRHEIVVHGKTGIVKKFSVRGGANLWVALRKAGVPIGASCSGVGVCAACDVKAEPRNSLTAQTDFEIQSLNRNHKTATNDECQSVRLACLCRVIGGLNLRTDYW